MIIFDSDVSESMTKGALQELLTARHELDKLSVKWKKAYIATFGKRPKNLSEKKQLTHKSVYIL